MEVPCVRVPREAGEETRRTLAAADLLDGTHEITAADGWLYLPVVDPEAVPGDLPVVTREVPDRDRQTVPADLLEAPPSYERVGDVAILDEDDPDRARAVADAIVRSDLPVAVVLNKRSAVEGTERVREWDLLEGDRTETVHREYGFEYAVDLAAVYFSPRLATERHRVVSQVAADERVFDMFAGVGPFAIPAAARGATCVAVDVNETAVAYLEENAERNGVADAVTAVAGDVRSVAPSYPDWADRVVMNLPHSTDAFLESALAVAGDRCRLHYYDIQHEDDPFGPGERAIRAAAGDDYAVEVATRRRVRSYAPHELNVCLDVDLRRR